MVLPTAINVLNGTKSFELIVICWIDVGKASVTNADKTPLGVVIISPLFLRLLRLDPNCQKSHRERNCYWLSLPELHPSLLRDDPLRPWCSVWLAAPSKSRNFI
jgi:hypothetical protein